MPRSAVLILVFNRIDFTKKVIERYLANTRHPHKLVIADSGSVDGTKEYLKGLESSGIDVEFIYYKKNYGAHRPRAHFQHLYGKSYEFLGFVANDVYVTPNWLPDFESAMDRVPKIGILGPVDRDWEGAPIAEENGFRFLNEYEFYFSDAFWLMRSSIIPELQKQVLSYHEPSLGHSWAHPGYFFLNSPILTQAEYYNSIKRAGYHTACDLRHKMRFVQDEEPTDAEWHRQYTILVKRIANRNPAKYAAEIDGEMEYELRGKTMKWQDEPEIVRRAPDSFIKCYADSALMAQLDNGVPEDYENKLTREQWNSLTFEQVFRRG